MRRLTLDGVARFLTTVIWRYNKLRAWCSERISTSFPLGFRWENTLTTVDENKPFRHQFCAPWPCGQTESMLNQAVMTGCGDQDKCAQTNLETQRWRIEWEISQIRKVLHSPARSFHLLAALSGSRETPPDTQHQRCHQQHDIVRSFCSSHNTHLFV